MTERVQLVKIPQVTYSHFLCCASVDLCKEKITIQSSVFFYNCPWSLFDYHVVVDCCVFVFLFVGLLICRCLHWMLAALAVVFLEQMWVLASWMWKNTNCKILRNSPKAHDSLLFSKYCWQSLVDCCVFSFFSIVYCWIAERCMFALDVGCCFDCGFVGTNVNARELNVKKYKL